MREHQRPKWSSTNLNQRTHEVIITLLFRQNDVATSFWHNDDVISPCVWCELTLVNQMTLFKMAVESKRVRGTNYWLTVSWWRHMASEILINIGSSNTLWKLKSRYHNILHSLVSMPHRIKLDIITYLCLQLGKNWRKSVQVLHTTFVYDNWKLYMLASVTGLVVSCVDCPCCNFGGALANDSAFNQFTLLNICFNKLNCSYYNETKILP